MSEEHAAPPAVANAARQIEALIWGELNGRISAEALARRLRVSYGTCRRALEVLEAQGRVLGLRHPPNVRTWIVVPAHILARNPSNVEDAVRQDFLKVGDLRFNPWTGEARRGSRSAWLRPVDARVLERFAREPTRAFTTTELVWTHWDGYASAGTVHSIIRAIRRKLGGDVIRTLPGGDYTLGLTAKHGPETMRSGELGIHGPARQLSRHGQHVAVTPRGLALVEAGRRREGSSPTDRSHHELALGACRLCTTLNHARHSSRAHSPRGDAGDRIRAPAMLQRPASCASRMSGSA